MKTSLFHRWNLALDDGILHVVFVVGSFYDSFHQAKSIRDEISVANEQNQAGFWS